MTLGREAPLARVPGDNDCNRRVDADDPGCGAAPSCVDADEDGFAACDGTCLPPNGTQCGDCDDADAAVHPAALEGPAVPLACTDAVDNDCDRRRDADEQECAPAAAAGDYDIVSMGAGMYATVGRAVMIKVAVKQATASDAGATLGVSGVQDVKNAGTSKVLIPIVADKAISGSATYMFSYVPTAAGNIVWTATVDDADADVDQATATTVVR